MRNVQKQVDMFVNKHIEGIEGEGVYVGLSENGKIYIISASNEYGITSSIQFLNSEQDGC